MERQHDLARWRACADRWQPDLGERPSRVTRLDDMSSEELRRLASYEDAVTLNQMYRDAMPQVPTNRTANPRVVLSQKVIDAWKEIL